MNNQNRFSKVCGLGMSFAMVSLLAVAAGAQDAKDVQGMIVGRDGPTMYVRTIESPRQIVVLSDSTKATEKGGFLGIGKHDLGIEALVPGLDVKIDGMYDGDHKLVAKKIEFTRNSMRTAKQIDAGLTPVNSKVAAQQDAIMSARRDIESSQQEIADSKVAITANGQAIDQTKQAVTQTNGRIGQLDTYEEKGSVTVNFKNGKSVVSKEDQDKLEDFVKTAANTPGFMVQVQGFASATGSPALNQKLSSERADAVLSIIQQSGVVPMTRILAPAAMGTTNQVADNHSRGGQAQNRRVVVTILVNKGITAGSSDQSASTSSSSPGQE